MKNYIFFFFAFILTITFVNCNSDDDSIDKKSGIIKKCFLQKVIVNGSLSREYFLNEENKVEILKHYNSLSGDLLLIEEMFYDVEGRIERIDQYNNYAELSGYLTYEYFGNDSIRSNEYRIDSSGVELKEYSIYYFEDSGNCTFSSRYRYDADPDSLFRYYLVQYLDDKCSSIFETFFPNGDLFTSKKSINDDKIGADYFVSAIPFSEMNRHNILQQEWMSDLVINISSKSYNSVFEYNEDDYPIKETRTYLDGDIVEFTFEYQCE